MVEPRAPVSRGRRFRLLLALAACALVAWSTACARRDAVVFNVDNARAHVAMLAETIGSRPVGTSANAKARAYAIDQLRFFGFDVRVQEIDAVHSEAGLTARVANIIAIKAGTRTDALGLVAHYDSVAEGAGALDDALGVAVALEAARVLAAQTTRQHSLMVILTDGEEAGLFGAAAAVTDPDVKARLRAYLNVEAIGASGPSVMFEAGPRSGLLLRAWAQAAPEPHGSSYSTEIYKKLPNDTDFTIFRRAGFSGLNFSPIGDSYPYHTSRDKADRLSPETIRQTGDNVVAIARALDAADLASIPTSDSSDSLRFFDLARRHAFVYGPVMAGVLAVAAVLLGLFAWVRMLRATLDGGAWRLIVTVLWSIVALATSVGAMVGAIWLLRAVREVYHPWYAHPNRLLLLLVAAGIGAPWYITRLMSFLPAAVRSHRTPQAVWTMVLPLWIGLSIAMEIIAPAAGYLWTLPLLFAGLLLSIVPARTAALVRLASVGIAVVAALFWLADGLDLFRFVIAMFGRLPLITPIWIYPAVLALIGLMLAPPCVAVVAGLARGRTMHAVVGGLWALLFAVAIGLAYFGHAYTPERPLRRMAFYTQDTQAGHAWWEVGSLEPGLDLDASAAAHNPSKWQLERPRTPLPTSLPLPGLSSPFVFRSDAAATSAPVDVSASINIRENAAIDVTVVPRQEGVTLTFLLPEGLQPMTANLAGAMQSRDRRWRATYTAVPAGGVAFRAEVPAALANRLSETMVLVSVSRAPEPDGPRVPAWAPQARTDWTVRSRWLLQPTRMNTPAAPVEAPSTAPAATPALPAPTAPATAPGTPAPTAPPPPPPETPPAAKPPAARAAAGA